MENVQKEYGLNNWEYYLAIILSIIAVVAVVAVALRVFGLI
ncbi:MAG: hypothetical protein AABX98_04030 [Nanoarchaeota archaeon]